MQHDKLLTLRVAIFNSSKPHEVLQSKPLITDIISLSQPMLPEREMRLQTKRRWFLGLLLTTVTVNIVIQVWWEREVVKEPPYSLQRRFLTMHCQDSRRLGNLMFNYASAVGIATRYNMTVLMEENFPLFDFFELSAEKSTNVLNSLGMFQEYEEYGKRACAYDIQTEQFNPRISGLMLHGYYQSWKYFSHIAPTIHKEFRFKDWIMAEARLFHSELRTKVVDLRKSKNLSSDMHVIKVGIHIRRGDVLEEKFANYGYNTPGMEFYKKAMAHFIDKFPQNIVLFIVCTDDPTWAQENLAGPNIVHCSAAGRNPTVGSHVSVGRNVAFVRNPAVVDLAILSLCEHSVVSVGSFGWWAAWLVNSNHTLYYGDWPRAVSNLEYMVTKQDYFLPHWMPIYDKY